MAQVKVRHILSFRSHAAQSIGSYDEEEALVLAQAGIVEIIDEDDERLDPAEVERIEATSTGAPTWKTPEVDTADLGTPDLGTLDEDDEPEPSHTFDTFETQIGGTEEPDPEAD